MRLWRTHHSKPQSRAKPPLLPSHKPSFVIPNQIVKIRLVGLLPGRELPLQLQVIFVFQWDRIPLKIEKALSITTFLSSPWHFKYEFGPLSRFFPSSSFMPFVLFSLLSLPLWLLSGDLSTVSSGNISGEISSDPFSHSSPAIFFLEVDLSHGSFFSSYWSFDLFARVLWFWCMYSIYLFWICD